MIGWWLLWSLVVAVLAWQTRQALREPLERDRITAAADERAADAAALDDLELIWSMPEYDPELDAGCDRLRQAIREHGEESP